MLTVNEEAPGLWAVWRDRVVGQNGVSGTIVAGLFGSEDEANAAMRSLT